MKDHRLAYAIPVASAVGLLVFSLLVYAGFLTSSWGTLFACLPAIVVTIGVVGGMACGMLFFEAEEDETAEEAAQLDGTAIFDWLGKRLDRLVHRSRIAH